MSNSKIIINYPKDINLVEFEKDQMNDDILVGSIKRFINLDANTKTAAAHSISYPLTIRDVYSELNRVSEALGTTNISKNINKIKEWLEGFTNTELFSAEIYFLSNLPAKVEFVEVFYVIVTSLIICFLASFYPAWRASKMNPIDLIRKE